MDGGGARLWRRRSALSPLGCCPSGAARGRRRADRRHGPESQRAVQVGDPHPSGGCSRSVGPGGGRRHPLHLGAANAAGPGRGRAAGRARDACNRAELLNVLDMAAMGELLERSRGHPGTRALRSVLRSDLGEGVPRTELERRFLALCRRAALPSPSVNAWISLAGEEMQFDSCGTGSASWWRSMAGTRIAPAAHSRRIVAATGFSVSPVGSRFGSPGGTSANKELRSKRRSGRSSLSVGWWVTFRFGVAVAAAENRRPCRRFSTGGGEGVDGGREPALVGTPSATGGSSRTRGRGRPSRGPGWSRRSRWYPGPRR